MSLEIILAGHGKMARAVAAECEVQDVKIGRFSEELADRPVVTEFPYHNVVGVHFGSGKELPALIRYCEPRKIPIIQGSTKVELPETSSTVIIDAPNLSLPIVKFMSAFPAFVNAIKGGMEIGIVESHQRFKIDTSGTARAIAKMLGIQEQMIKSIRDRDIQLAYGVPEEHLEGHAYHSFMFVGQGGSIEVKLKIHGRETYAKGTLLVAEALAKNAKLEPEIGIYNCPVLPGVHSLADKKVLYGLGFIDSVV